MANLASSKKAIRRQKRETVKNLRRHRTYRDARKQTIKAISAGNQEEATQSLSEFYKAVDKAAKANGPLHKNTASRYKSNLAQKVATAFTK